MRRQLRGFWLTATVLAFVLLFSPATSSLLTPQAYAQEGTPSGLLNKLNELKSEIASKAAQLKTEINKKVQNKAVAGRILNIDDSEVIIETIGSTKTVKIDEFTEVIGNQNKKIKIETLEESDNIAALGDMDDKNNLVARRLVFLNNFATGSSILIRGQIQKTSGSVITISDKEGLSRNIITNQQTDFFLGINEASISDSKVEQFLIARGVKNKDGSLKARFIYFIPAVGFVKPSESKSPSVTKSATPSASKKP